MSYIKKRKEKKNNNDWDTSSNKDKSHTMWSGDKIKEILKKAGLC
jgi:hypothetical protein